MRKQQNINIVQLAAKRSKPTKVILPTNLHCSYEKNFSSSMTCQPKENGFLQLRGFSGLKR